METSGNNYRRKKTNLYSGLIFTFLILGAGFFAHAQDISVMTLNIRYNNPADGINKWEARRDWLCGYLQFSNADLIGGQEVMKSQLSDMRESLPAYSYIGIARNGKEEGEYCPIFYKTERFEVLDHGTFWLSETPSKVDSQGWDAALPRIVTWGKFRDKKLKKEIYLFNTHFDHRGEVARVESSRLLIRKVEEIAGDNPVFITGDLNFSPDGLAYEALTSSANKKLNLKDSALEEALVYGPAYTFNGFRLEPEPEGERIDYIFTKGAIDVQSYQVVDGQRGGKYISDHFPVLVKADIIN